MKTHASTFRLIGDWRGVSPIRRALPITALRLTPNRLPMTDAENPRCQSIVSCLIFSSVHTWSVFFPKLQSSAIFSPLFQEFQHPISGLPHFQFGMVCHYPIDHRAPIFARELGFSVAGCVPIKPKRVTRRRQMRNGTVGDHSFFSRRSMHRSMSPISRATASQLRPHRSYL